jgi:pyruvate/2-oxoglutarate/acetoin dehydrogenase E1 component/TPP-dependent pyruvate/acetoin dehydrogenase alpha subunit
MREKFYRSLQRIRRVEERIAEIYPSDQIKSPIHLSIGQEAVSVGVCEALARDDVVFCTYRSHAPYLAKGGDLRGMFAELYGKETGCARGKGGSMHLVDVSAGVMGASAVVGTTIANAVGYAYALKYQQSDRVVVSFFGDGAVEEGVFHESMNFAALKALPILFICENNRYAIHTPQYRRQKLTDICARVRTYGIPAERIENNDPFQIHEKVSAAVRAIRAGGPGPRFFECMTYRWCEHVGPGTDFHLGYRSEEEAKPWMESDPLRVLGESLPEARRTRIQSEVEAEIGDAIQFAARSSFPEASELYTDIFRNSERHVTDEPSSAGAHNSLDRALSYVDAIREALEQELARDPSVLVYGLDVDDPKAILGSTRGLVEKFGPERVFGTPLSEDAMTGAAVGMALAGLRPVHVHIRMDFLMLAMNQLVNVAAKYLYMYGGKKSLPIVVRALIGKSWGQGAQHSQALYAFFMHVPGFKVVAPSTPYDAKGCLIAAIQDPNPVLMVEHRILYYQKGPVPTAAYTVKPGKARVTASGTDITLVGISYMQIECLRARCYLEEKEINAEVIDPIWLAPLDLDTIVNSARKTGRLCVVDNGWLTCGASAEIIVQVIERLQGKQVIQVQRLGFAPVTCPTTPPLEDLFYPNARTIAAAAHTMVTGRTDWMPAERADLKAIEFKGPF